MPTEIDSITINWSPGAVNGVPMEGMIITYDHEGLLFHKSAGGQKLGEFIPEEYISFKKNENPVLSVNTVCMDNNFSGAQMVEVPQLSPLASEGDPYVFEKTISVGTVPNSALARKVVTRAVYFNDRNGDKVQINEQVIREQKGGDLEVISTELRSSAGNNPLVVDDILGKSILDAAVPA